MPKQRTREEAAAYMCEYRAKRKAEGQRLAAPDAARLAAFGSPDARCTRPPPLSSWRVHSLI